MKIGHFRQVLGKQSRNSTEMAEHALKLAASNRETEH